MLSTRHKVLSLYRQVLRLGHKWQSVSGNSQNTNEEKQYIMSEARRLFRKNKPVSSSIKLMLLHLHKIVEGLYFHCSLSVCVCVCVSVCLSVCVSNFLVNKIPAERMHRFGRGFR